MGSASGSGESYSRSLETTSYAYTVSIDLGYIPKQ
jgi:hypothetical protein